MAKVLLFDDDIELCELLKEELVATEWAVETAYNGRDGLQLLQNFAYDLIVLDWQMPDHNGIDGQQNLLTCASLWRECVDVSPTPRTAPRQPLATLMLQSIIFEKKGWRRQGKLLPSL